MAMSSALKIYAALGIYKKPANIIKLAQYITF